jgi:hypothetical protein
VTDMSGRTRYRRSASRPIRLQIDDASSRGFAVGFLMPTH